MRKHRHHIRTVSSMPLAKLFLFCVVLAICGFFLFHKDKPRSYSIQHILTKHTLHKTKLFAEIPTIIPSATPTATLTPSPILEVANPNNYCLNVPMLYYHHIEPLAQAATEGHKQLTVDDKIFESQMAYLNSAGYTTVTASDIVDAIRNHSTLPTKSIEVGFDDGYTDIYTYAYPIFQKYSIHADLMIPTGLLENPDYLTWSQLKEMAGNPLIHIYNHTWSHAALGILTKDKIEFQVNTDEQQLQDHLGIKPTVFTYPYGSSSPLAVATLRELGYTGGLSTTGGRLQCENNIMTLHRNAIGNAPLSIYGL